MSYQKIAFTYTKGRTSACVEASSMIFINHGCNGTSNVGEELDFPEFSLELGVEYEVAFGNDEVTESGSNYVEDRQRSGWSTIANANLNQGNEILCNYLSLSGQQRWSKQLSEIRSFCSGRLGAVSQYELNHTEGTIK
jgi:hypothetical protein